MQVQIRTQYSCCPVTEIDIPNITSWNEVEEWGIKWGNLEYKVKGKWYEIDLEGDYLDAIDYKRPVMATVLEPGTGKVINELQSWIDRVPRTPGLSRRDETL